MAFFISEDCASARRPCSDHAAARPRHKVERHYDLTSGNAASLVQ